MVPIEDILPHVAKPSQYLGCEVNSVRKDFDRADLRIALIFPDKYELGMSHNGLKILYKILNDIPGVVCERAFAPDLDMEGELRKRGLPLFSLESRRSLKEFDILGFSVTYELTYTNILNILDLAGIPVWQRERSDTDPLILGGGGCLMNAEPIADFLDAGALGDGEELIVDVVRAVMAAKQGRLSRAALLDSLSSIAGIYIPSLFDVVYHEDNTIKAIVPLKPGYERIAKRLVDQLDQSPYPTKLIVPSIRLVHDRIGIEIQRGCNRACRFCQAGYIDRPVRQRSPQNILNLAEASLEATGMEEISLLSLSAADYDCLVPLLQEMNGRYAQKNVAISVPATRTEKLTPDLIREIKRVRKTGFTIAPEAGSARMRRVINKGNEVDDLYRAVENAFSEGWDLLKLYYMVGLPFEHDEDLFGIADEANQSIKICLRYSRRSELKLSLSSFVPKPHTPFQWSAQMGIEETKRRYALVRRSLKNHRIRCSQHHPEMSYIEGILSRGDRRVSQLLYLAHREGCRFDEWEEHFDFSRWQRAFIAFEIDPTFYVERVRDGDEVLPWDHLFSQMDRRFLWDEYVKAAEAAGSEVPSLTAREARLAQWKHEAPRAAWKRLRQFAGHAPGFTEDCSVERCTNCGVCDYKEIKNRIYRNGNQELLAKKGHREWYGWERPNPTQDMDTPPTLEPDLDSSGHHYRIRFAKKGTARFIGHLDLMQNLRRLLKRAGLPMAYSQGFHPQMKLSMGQALSTGVESEWEFFDIVLLSALDVADMRDRLNKVALEGLRMLEVSKIDSSEPSLYSSVTEMGYRVSVRNGGGDWFHSAPETIQRFNNLKEFIWLKERDQKKVRSINLKEKISFDLAGFPESILLTTRTGMDGSVKPQEALKAVFRLEDKDFSNISLTKTSLTWQ